MASFFSLDGSHLYCARLIFRTDAGFAERWPSIHRALNPVEICHALQKNNLGIGAFALEARALAQRRRYEKYLQSKLASEFWGGARGQGMDRLLQALQRISFSHRGAKWSILDVGAAKYEGPDRCHAADLAILLGCNTSSMTIHALEPLEAQLVRTRRMAEQQLRRELKLTRRKASQCILWHQIAASNVTGVARMRGQSNQASLSTAIPESTSSPDYQEDQRHQRQSPHFVGTQRLDEFVHETNLGPVLFLKIDTEGHDLEVLQGARSLLDNGLVAVIVFEVAGQMNQDFFQIHKEDGFPRPDVAARLKGQLAEPNLRSIVKWLQPLGYESFLLGSRSLIPLSFSWWDSSYEVCISRAEIPCWYDVLAILMDNGAGFGTSLPQIRQPIFEAFEPVL
ncbi:unnamed protein product [Durusdinium trenchii]